MGYSIEDSAEVAIQKIIETNQRIITISNGDGGEEGVVGEEKQRGVGISTATRKHLELEIKILQDARRDVDKLEQLLKIK